MDFTMNNTSSTQETDQLQTVVPNITITPKAAEELIKIKQTNNIPEAYHLRVGIRGGGCCGLSYVLSFEEKVDEKDILFETNGIQAIVDPMSLPQMAGATLDYKQTEEATGFVFENPNTESSCNCGDEHGGDCCG